MKTPFQLSFSGYYTYFNETDGLKVTHYFDDYNEKSIRYNVIAKKKTKNFEIEVDEDEQFLDSSNLEDLYLSTKEEKKLNFIDDCIN
ncbi:MAG: hypothetical protein NXI18_20600 [Alphaproteobacteria bacterium]|jgi:hypothetical protein|nr:hypothetical protein [Alphaproteobacteria bacterium]